jgi:hypothetical protein
MIPCHNFFHGHITTGLSQSIILTYQLSKLHDQRGRKLQCTSTKIYVRQFSTPYFVLDVSSRFQYYLWLVDSADSQNMIDCDKPVVMWPNVSVKKNNDTESYKIVLLHLAIIDLIWFKFSNFGRQFSKIERQFSTPSLYFFSYIPYTVAAGAKPLPYITYLFL